ncbi:unnamed protein product [Parascedosporium putredinis]|nr:unnamed protein product [Parascedosporium putredinis]CAI7997399.1 unnamed protein product [Parascedosporium putredinis]
MTCFIPSLEPNTPFHVSVHSWIQEPELSIFTKLSLSIPKRSNSRLGYILTDALLGDEQYDRYLDPLDKLTHKNLLLLTVPSD